MPWEDAKRVDILEEAVNAKGATWEASLIKKCSEAAKVSAGGNPSVSWEKNFTGKLKVELTLVFELFMKMSSAPDKPGDMLEAILTKVDQEIVILQGKLNSGIRTATAGTTANASVSMGGTGLW
eukprot:CAMPEP_0178911696 /NCGR_PEP_ID=MMETSP0786-20121207/9846_1 /TAXON_ID=186022 /ORGANISM="Thalassionema frauenfeldii, Strain CCMP 1798" /LENGTH=123 /DNA_ID=CAMNT_0020584187 /DNA_START=1559 /DNA_END=1927 /DNA_ORIENTATION=-